MRRLKIIEHISLDGVPYRTPAGRDEIIAAQGGRFDPLRGRRTHDAWSGF